MQTLSNKQPEGNKTKKELEAISEKIKDSKVKVEDILIPAAATIILLMLSIFVFVPMIKATIAFQQEYESLKQKEETLVKLEEKLKGIDDATMQVDLLNAKSVIPKTLRVSMFVYYIDTLANEKNLTSKSLSAGDVTVSFTNKDKNNEKKSYLGVSGPLSYTGTLQDILSFLDSLYSASPYIISADNISFKKTGELWRVDLGVIGYYVPERAYNVDYYTAFNEYTQYADVIGIFSKKAEELKE